MSRSQADELLEEARRLCPEVALRIHAEHLDGERLYVLDVLDPSVQEERRKELSRGLYRYCYARDWPAAYAVDYARHDVTILSGATTQTSQFEGYAACAAQYTPAYSARQRQDISTGVVTVWLGKLSELAQRLVGRTTIPHSEVTDLEKAAELLGSITTSVALTLEYQTPPFVQPVSDSRATHQARRSLLRGFLRAA